MLDSRCIERFTARVQSGPRSHDVVHQHHALATGERVHRKRAGHVGAALAGRQAALLSGGTRAAQQLRGKAGPNTLRQRAPEQRRRIEATLDQSQVVERNRNETETRRCSGTQAWQRPRQQARERSGEVGSVAELEAADGRRERRQVAATRPAVEPGAGSGRCRTRSTARTEDLLALHRGVARGTVVGRERAHEQLRASSCCAGEAVPVDHVPLIGGWTAQLRSEARDPSDRRLDCARILDRALGSRQHTKIAAPRTALSQVCWPERGRLRRVGSSARRGAQDVCEGAAKRCGRTTAG